LKISADLAVSMEKDMGKGAREWGLRRDRIREED
jgi:hypothetical protein